MKGLMFDCAKGEASKEIDRNRIIAAIGAVEEQQQLNWSLHGRVAAASLRPALEQGGKLAELAIDAIKKGRLVRFELAMTESKADTVENVQSLVSALDPETLQQLALFSQCWKRANEWLAEAIAGRVFASLLKLELQSESLLRHCLSVPHRCSACFARSPQPSSTACSCLPTAAPGHPLLCPPHRSPPPLPGLPPHCCPPLLPALTPHRCPLPLPALPPVHTGTRPTINTGFSLVLWSLVYKCRALSVHKLALGLSESTNSLLKRSQSTN